MHHNIIILLYINYKKYGFGEYEKFQVSETLSVMFLNITAKSSLSAKAGASAADTIY